MEKGKPFLTLIQGDGPRPKFKETPAPLAPISQVRGDQWTHVRNALVEKSGAENDSDALIEKADRMVEELFEYIANHPEPTPMQNIFIQKGLDALVLDFLKADAWDRLEGLEQRLKAVERNGDADYVAQSVRTAHW